MLVKRSVTSSLAKALICIVVLSVLSTGLALTTVADSLRDAEAVNIAGSLRMQSYRLAYDLAQHNAMLEQHLAAYQHTLQAPALQKLDRFYVPQEVREKYLSLLQAWQRLEQQIHNGQTQYYQDNVASYVSQIDRFVLALQRYSELKLAIVATISVVGYIAIIGLVLFCIRFMRRQVVAPLKQLVAASQRVQQRDFNHPPLDVALPNELGVLSTAFTAMSSDLSRLYQSLEQKVQEKTERLQQANKTLEVMYSCSQALSVGQIDQQAFEEVLRIVRHSERLPCIQLNVQDSFSQWRLGSGEALADRAWQRLTIMQEDRPLGQLSWQTDAQMPNPHLMQSVANMLGRGVYFNRTQKQHVQFLLMEERATIARELHDSLAQALTFLRIQMTLLKRTLADGSPQAQSIIADFERALADAYRQLRELLATFRLSIQEADLNTALQQLLAPLKMLTRARIRLHCRLSSQALNAQQQVHALQIVREAVLNAIKHADAQEIVIHCSMAANGDNHICISDDGCGIDSLDEPEGHYGLSIMSERAARLGGRLHIARGERGGTDVCLTFPP
ncbi:nitrate/nitrite two-component system sensor histidine kinase NarQ [Serratia sp. AKBS12]|uniref:nitrate/nitrite two-component system sensor histidine kinase NarQ n=1 Tax=Serratia sp. AKBS12 TaxID=2974597 RepID=UPI0021659958|nr:nitrate/nitrite two-component system sensor histidine kinase NarQ [Serratia sp. AKBS12]MCS3407666.1 nitrate/nitrite two-component system sensor histidine kinase NarQ [Serratia sp. AKBS12]HEI8867502.1 nitrate/nitrite two-component system sensor histidine kinase NarQ [Serratia odorifera]